MLVSLKYAGRSQILPASNGGQILNIAPNRAWRTAADAGSVRDSAHGHSSSPVNTVQDTVAFEATVKDPVRFREALSSLHEIALPFDPILTVADDGVFAECFSADESSYGCLSLDRDACFSSPEKVQCGTANVDYSPELYAGVQSLRSYHSLQFRVNADSPPLPASAGLPAGSSELAEEKVVLPEQWLRGFVQLQAAMALPMKKVSLDVGAVYSLLTWLRRHGDKPGPRAIRFELQANQSPRLLIEPSNVCIESPGTVYRGTGAESIRVWGRRRLLSLSRLLPLATHVDVYLTGTALPSFWVVQMGVLRMTLGLSGWTAGDWTRGSAVQMMFPMHEPDSMQVTAAQELLRVRRALSLESVAAHLKCSPGVAAAVMHQLALRGQVFFDLQARVFRWRPILGVALSDRDLGTPHAEIEAGSQLAARGAVKIETRQEAKNGGLILTGKVDNQSCEVVLDGDGVVRNGKCRCTWHVRFGVRQSACRHLQALRNHAWFPTHDQSADWYEQRQAWSC